MTGTDAGRRDDPNRSRGGARQRWGPFWMDEPSWFRLLALLVLLAAVCLFALALHFDHP